MFVGQRVGLWYGGRGGGGYGEGLDLLSKDLILEWFAFLLCSVNFLVSFQIWQVNVMDSYI